MMNTKQSSSTSPAKKKFVMIKIYFDRARMYLGYINFFILNFVLISSIDNEGVKSFLSENKILFISLFIISTFAVFIIIGFLDKKLGLWQEELRSNAAFNPIITELLENTRATKKDLDLIKSKMDLEQNDD